MTPHGPVGEIPTVRIYEMQNPEARFKPTPEQRLEVERQVREQMETWLPILGLEHVTVNVNWKDDETRVGGAYARVEYDNLVITYIPNMLVDPIEVPDLEELILHELAHIFSWDAWEAFDDLREALIEALELEGAAAMAIRRMNTQRFKIIFERMTTRISYALMRAHGRDLSQRLWIDPINEGRDDGAEERTVAEVGDQAPDS